MNVALLPVFVVGLLGSVHRAGMCGGIVGAPEEEITMEALYLLVPLSVMLVAFAVWIFFGAADSGQFDGLEGPASRILHDDE